MTEDDLVVTSRYTLPKGIDRQSIDGTFEVTEHSEDRNTVHPGHIRMNVYATVSSPLFSDGPDVRVHALLEMDVFERLRPFYAKPVTLQLRRKNLTATFVTRIKLGSDDFAVMPVPPNPSPAAAEAP